MTTTLYGISNCDTVRKARRWLDTQGVNYRFHDFRVDGLRKEHLEEWLEARPWNELVNRRSTSWKALSPEARDGMDRETAVEAMLATPTLIKRPVLVTGHELELGFSPERYAELLAP